MKQDRTIHKAIAKLVADSPALAVGKTKAFLKKFKKHLAYEAAGKDHRGYNLSVQFSTPSQSDVMTLGVGTSLSDFSLEQAEVNWCATGSQTPAKTAEFAATLATVASLAAQINALIDGYNAKEKA